MIDWNAPLETYNNNYPVTIVHVCPVSGNLLISWKSGSDVTYAFANPQGTKIVTLHLMHHSIADKIDGVDFLIRNVEKREYSLVSPTYTRIPYSNSMGENLFTLTEALRLLPNCPIHTFIAKKIS